MPLFKKILFKLLFFAVCMTQSVNTMAQLCNGSWALQRPLTAECVIGQWIGWQSGGSNPPGCPINPVYIGVQSNTFTFIQPVSTFSIDFRGFDGSIQCPRIEIKINGVFYPLTVANLVDIPPGSSCTGSFPSLAVTPDGYITIGSFSPSSAQGRIVIDNVTATSVTVSTNDGNGTTFSNPFNCISVVPLEVESFTGINKDCKALLNLTTGTEFNVKGIEVQRSEDGVIFNKAGEVAPKGSNSQYAFIADNLKDGYFRLKINDLDGSYEYSETLYIRSTCKTNSYAIVPNPAADYVEIVGLTNADYLIITDILGKICLQFDASQNNKLNIQSLSRGMYIIKVFNAGTCKATLKLIKN